MDRIGFARKTFVAVACIALVIGIRAAANADVGVTINGNGVNVWPAPILQGGRVLVPLRGVFQDLGATVVYSNGVINATGNGSEISLTIGSTQATVNGSPVTIDTAPFIVGASTYVPLRFVSQALGATVSWDEGQQTVDISYAGATNTQTDSDSDQDVSQAPPPIPTYVPPPVPAPNYVWVPGYWAWGPYGYYWVPGTWQQAPQIGLLWTPGYWSWQAGNFGWNPGYWAPQVGFYGGVNYGAGYYGNGYVGGNWSPNGFRYNRAVYPAVNTTIIHNVYVDNTVVVNNTANRPSYNGGPHGIATQPNTREIAVGRMSHVPMTTAQQQHAQVAASDHQLLQSVNAGKPAVVVAPHAFTPAAKPAGFIPVTPKDRPAAPASIIHATPAPMYHAPVRPVATLAPVYHAPVRPVVTPAPVYHAPVRPVVTPTPVPHRVIVTPTPHDSPTPLR